MDKRLDIEQVASIAACAINRGLDSKITDGRGNSALHYMAEIGCVSAVRKLLSHGADRQHQNDEGLTAWDVANGEGNRRTRRCLEGQEAGSCDDMEIRWFSRRRGYGYIRNSICGDIYFEHSCEPGGGIEEGTRLEFDLGCDDFGLTADNIKNIIHPSPGLDLVLRGPLRCLERRNSYPQSNFRFSPK